MPRILTVRKERWRDQFKPDLLRGTALNPNVSTTLRYYGKLADLVREMSEETEREIRKLFRAPEAEVYFAQDATMSAQAKILTNALLKRFQRIFDLRSKTYADGMVRDADKDSSKSLHSSLKDLSGGLSLKTTVLTGELKQIMSASVVENVNLIRSIPQKYLNGVQQAVMRSITTGNGLADLVPWLEKERGVTLRRARIIAEDQTRKAFSNISRVRMEKVGLKQFEWLHSQGSLHPRKLHIAHNGRIFDFANPPVIEEKTGERGFPGQAINCRCRMRPVVTFAGEENAPRNR